MSESATRGDLTTGPRPTGKAAAAASAEERRRMVAEAAYYRAAARGFQGGDPLDDWVAAEAEITRMLQGSKEERAAYERLRAEVQKGLAALRGAITAQSAQDTLERTANRLKKAGEYAAGAINKATERLKNDIARSPVAAGPGWEALSSKTSGLFAAWRVRSSVLLARAAIGASDWLSQTGRRLERTAYEAGDTAGGDFECARCGAVVHVAAGERVPACPKCRQLEFRRVRSR